MAFRGLQAESATQGAAYSAIAKDLHTLVTDPFEAWARGYKVGNFGPLNPCSCLIRRVVGANQSKQGQHY